MKPFFSHISALLCGLFASCAALCFLDLVWLPTEKYPRFSVFLAVGLLLSVLVALFWAVLTLGQWYTHGGRKRTVILYLLEAGIVFLPGMLSWDLLFSWLRQVF